MSSPARFTSRDLMVAAMMNLLWGLNIIAVKLSVEATAPLVAATLRQLFVFAICAPALAIVPGKMRQILALGALSGALFYIFVNWSLAVSENVAALAIAGQVGVPFSLILGIIFLGERIRLARLAGIALAFSGVVLLVFDPAAGKEIPGLLLTAAGSFVWAVSSLIQRGMRGVRLMTLYAWIGLIGTLVLAPLALLFEPDAVRALPDLALGDFGWIAFSAIGSTLLGHGAMSWLLQRHAIATVVPLTLAAPVISVIAASLFFQTPVTLLMVVGGTIALLGVAIVTIRTARAGEKGGQGGLIETFSPNFDDRSLPVTMIVLHYTGMADAASAIAWLANPESKVSCHYVVAEDGQVIRMVDERKRAWHAGRSHWRGITDINSASIGIEIVNPGHEHGYRPFPEPQIDALIPLVAEIKDRYRITRGNIVGHSDIAPARKRDPGELFPWGRLARLRLALPRPTKNLMDPGWTDAGFLLALERFGYEVTEPMAAVVAFQRRFRPELIDGEIDAECRSILLALLLPQPQGDD